MCAGVLAYECDGEVEDVGLYKDYTLAVLTGGDAQQHKGRLALLPTAALARHPLPEGALHVGPGLKQRIRHMSKEVAAGTATGFRLGCNPVS